MGSQRQDPRAGSSDRRAADTSCVAALRETGNRRTA
jgi:hypothetical protein